MEGTHNGEGAHYVGIIRPQERVPEVIVVESDSDSEELHERVQPNTEKRDSGDAVSSVYDEVIASVLSIFPDVDVDIILPLVREVSAICTTQDQMVGRLCEILLQNSIAAVDGQQHRESPPQNEADTSMHANQLFNAPGEPLPSTSRATTHFDIEPHNSSNDKIQIDVSNSIEDESNNVLPVENANADVALSTKEAALTVEDDQDNSQEDIVDKCDADMNDVSCLSTAEVDISTVKNSFQSLISPDIITEPDKNMIAVDNVSKDTFLKTQKFRDFLQGLMADKDLIVNMSPGVGGKDVVVLPPNKERNKDDLVTPVPELDAGKGALRMEEEKGEAPSTEYSAKISGTVTLKVLHGGANHRQCGEALSRESEDDIYRPSTSSNTTFSRPFFESTEVVAGEAVGVSAGSVPPMEMDKYQSTDGSIASAKSSLCGIKRPPAYQMQVASSSSPKRIHLEEEEERADKEPFYREEGETSALEDMLIAVGEDGTYECQCCYSDVPFEDLVQCQEGHLFCCECLRRYTQEAIYGGGKVNLTCMSDGCTASFSPSQLRRALSNDMYARYEERVEQEFISLAELEDFVRCKYCNVGAELEKGQNIFNCPNEECKKSFCRQCNIDWEDHVGLKCHEVEKKDETQIRLEFEEKMAQAKIRQCSKCSAKFTKEDGCNKITCRCGATMCYICRKQKIGYNHFCQHLRQGLPGNKCTKCTNCSLWSNAEEDDDLAIRELKNDAYAARLLGGFEESKEIGAPTEANPSQRASQRNNYNRQFTDFMERLRRYNAHRARQLAVNMQNYRNGNFQVPLMVHYGNNDHRRDPNQPVAVLQGMYNLPDALNQNINRAAQDGQHQDVAANPAGPVGYYYRNNNLTISGVAAGRPPAQQPTRNDGKKAKCANCQREDRQRAPVDLLVGEMRQINFRNVMQNLVENRVPADGHQPLRVARQLAASVNRANRIAQQIKLEAPDDDQPRVVAEPQAKHRERAVPNAAATVNRIKIEAPDDDEPNAVAPQQEAARPPSACCQHVPPTTATRARPRAAPNSITFTSQVSGGVRRQTMVATMEENARNFAPSSFLLPANMLLTRPRQIPLRPDLNHNPTNDPRASKNRNPTDNALPAQGAPVVSTSGMGQNVASHVPPRTARTPQENRKASNSKQQEDAIVQMERLANQLLQLTTQARIQQAAGNNNGQLRRLIREIRYIMEEFKNKIPRP